MRLPACNRGVLIALGFYALCPEAGAPPADLVEHRATEKQERPEHRVRRDRLVGLFGEQGMPALPAKRRGQAARTGAAPTGAPPPRGGPARRAPPPAAVQRLWPAAPPPRA